MLKARTNLRLSDKNLFREEKLRGNLSTLREKISLLLSNETIRRRFQELRS